VSSRQASGGCYNPEQQNTELQPHLTREHQMKLYILRNRCLTAAFGVLMLFTAGPAAADAVHPRAVIETTVGNIELELLPEIAPNHVRNFLELARSGFYDGTLFHRVIPDFMIQGGDPNTKGEDKARYGQGGPGYTIKAEFNDQPHVRGVLSMARAQHPDSAGSQFFIVVKDSLFLDHQYTVFGRVTRGMEVADAIVTQERDRNDLPLQRVEMKVRVVEEEVKSEE
jgi:peptidyl-prolyl cis-trans isomerase B (cyclophilin B)